MTTEPERPNLCEPSCLVQWAVNIPNSGYVFRSLGVHIGGLLAKQKGYRRLFSRVKAILLSLRKNPQSIDALHGQIRLIDALIQ